MGSTSRARSWADEAVALAHGALDAHADAPRAAGAFGYMKGVAPFLGISAPDRRRLLRDAWRGLPGPDAEQLASAAHALMRQREREFHYAAYDLLQWYPKVPDDGFVRRHGARLLLSTPWWDTVDGLVTALVSPQLHHFRDEALVDEWSDSGERWLIRAAIGHQRGWKADTDIPRILHLCHQHWLDPEFFVAKAIGWAMRDIARMDANAVRAFLSVHPSSNRVAIREADRGLAASKAG